MGKDCQMTQVKKWLRSGPKGEIISNEVEEPGCSWCLIDSGALRGGVKDDPSGQVVKHWQKVS